MTARTSDREGWLTGALAKLPPCPPFPDLTPFETAALNCIAEMFDQDADAFRRQVASAAVVDRVNTVAGFYTRLVVDRARCEPLSISYKGGHFEVDEVPLGIGVVLWDDGGYLETIEGFTYDDDPLEGRDLAQLKFVRVEQLG